MANDVELPFLLSLERNNLENTLRFVTNVPDDEADVDDKDADDDDEDNESRDREL